MSSVVRLFSFVVKICKKDDLNNAKAGRSGAKIQLVWTHVAGTDNYEILRWANPSDPFSVIDTNNIVTGTTYYYFVRRT